MQKTSVVVPCYNEAARFQADAFVEFCAAHPAVSFVLVDDGSSDATFAVLSATASRAPSQIRVLRLGKNSGKAEAVRQGVLRAFESRAELVGFWDADLATPLYNITEFARLLERPALQLAMGSRVRLLGRRVERDGFRHYTGRGFATVAALALRMPIYDTQCGAKLFKASADLQAVFETPFELGWSFDVELIARVMQAARARGLCPEEQLIEVPLQEWFDAPGSKLRPSHAPRIAWEMCKLFSVARRR